jgi:hypothetical protein
MDRRQSPLPDHNGHGAAMSSEGTSRDSQSEPRRGPETNSDATPKQIRWVGRVLAILVILCLILAAWVWTGILHGVP